MKKVWSMKTKDKIIKLAEMGLSPETIYKLNENQIHILFNKIFLSEQGTVMISADKASGDTQKIKDLTSKGINVRIEGEMAEDNVDVTGSAMGGVTTQAPHQIMSPDGMSDDSDSKIDKYEDMTEADKKNNPFAICHSQLGPKKDEKFERCVKAVKKNLKEGIPVVNFFIEEKIVSLVENYLEPKMTKDEFMDTIAEQGVISRSVYKPKLKGGKSIRLSSPVRRSVRLQSMSETDAETAPAKPTTKPGTKPTTRPSHPGKKPFEGPNPGPKASKKDVEHAKNDMLKIIQSILRDGKK